MMVTMRHIVVCGAVLACAAVLAGEARAEVATFREEAFVKGPAILLGDLAALDGENAERLAKIEIAPAAQPGDSKRLEAALVAARAVEAIHVQNPDAERIKLEVKGARAIRTTTLHKEVTREMITDELRLYIQAAMPWKTDSAEIDVTPPPSGFDVPDGELGFQWRPSPGYRYLGTGAFRGAVTVDGEIKKTFLCKATVEAYGNVVVAAADIPRGAPLSPANVRTESVSLSTVNEPLITDPKDVAGLTAAKAIPAGQILTKSFVKPQILVKRRQLVAVETRAGGLRLQTQAQAEMDGAEGDLITCTNITSKQAFIGKVRADGVVVVE